MLHLDADSGSRKLRPNANFQSIAVHPKESAPHTSIGKDAQPQPSVQEGREGHPYVYFGCQESLPLGRGSPGSRRGFAEGRLHCNPRRGLTRTATGSETASDQRTGAPQENAAPDNPKDPDGIAGNVRGWGGHMVDRAASLVFKMLNLSLNCRRRGGGRRDGGVHGSSNCRQGRAHGAPKHPKRNDEGRKRGQAPGDRAVYRTASSRIRTACHPSADEQ